jgi:hypothetical protein
MGSSKETSFEPFNDFQALVMGIIRDNLDSRLLLSGNFRYQGKSPDLPLVSRLNNLHFSAFEERGMDPRLELERVQPQWADVPSIAGLLTTRGWAESHYFAGTNRRAAERTFQVFLCSPIVKWKDVGMPDNRVRRDVDRVPGGNPATYQTLCRNCHSIMDGLAGAFARFNFEKGAFKFSGSQVVKKMNQNNTVYPEGYVTVDDSWVNFATQNHNEGFGWQGPLTGIGVQALGTMVANSDAFRRCLTTSVFRQVCRRDPTELDAIEQHSIRFATAGYQLKSLYAELAVEPGCIVGTQTFS